MTKEQLEAIYRELLEDAKLVPSGSIVDERIDAQLCLIEDMLEVLENTYQ